MTVLWTMATILGLAVVTLVTRGFFVFSSRPWRLPSWAERGLQYAPIAALTAVVVPEVAVTQGHLVSTWMDARIFGAAAGMAVYFWRRDTLLTILAGMAVYLPLRLMAGW